MTTIFRPAGTVIDPNDIIVGEWFPTKGFEPDYAVPPPPSVPQVLPTIDVTVPGGHLFDITPKVISTETRVSSWPWWVWALGAVGLYFVLSGKAGRRRSSW